MKAYFDTGNDFDSSVYDVVTVAGLVARREHWERIERGWAGAIARTWDTCNIPDLYCPPYLHMTDLFTGNGPFSKHYGWNRTRKTALLNDCAEMIIRSMDDATLHAVSCSVHLKDYTRVVQDAQQATPHIIDTCANWCMAYACAIDPEDFQVNGAALFTDRNEPIYGAMTQIWNHRKLRNNYPWKKISQIAQAEMRVTPGIQMADMMAWSINDYIQTGCFRDEWHRLLIQQKRFWIELDERTLRNQKIENVKKYFALRPARRRQIK
jgi:hypothetical protein